MKDESKTKRQLISELNELRRQMADLKSTAETSVQTKESHEKFMKSFLQTSIPMGLSTLKEGRFVEVSEAFLKLMGLKRDEVIGKTSTGIGFITEENRSILFNELHKKGQIENLELQVNTKGGALCHGLFNAVMMTLNNEKYLLTVMIDVTNRKQVEEALERSERKYRNIFENVAEGIYQTTPEGRFLTVNSSCARMFGYNSPEEMMDSVTDIGQQIYVNHEDRERIKTILAEKDIIEGYEVQVYRRDKSKFWISLNVRVVRDPEGKVLYIEGTNTDITDRKRAEEDILKSEEKYRTVLENMEEGYHEVDLRGSFTFFNKSFQELMGYPHEEFMGMNYRQYAADDANRKKVFEAYNRVFRTGEPIDSFAWDIIRKDGDRRTVEVSASLIAGKDNQPVGFRGIVRDITDKKRTEEALRDSEARYRALFDNISSGVAIYDVKDNGDDFVFKDFNKSGEQIDGDCKEDIIGKSVLDVRPGIKEFGLFDVFKRVWETGKAEHYPVSLYKDRRLSKWYENYVYKLPSGEIVAAYDDITERKRAEEEIHATLREKTTLLNEIHHRVKNNLQVISSLLDLQAMSSGNPDVIRMSEESQRRIRSMAMIHETLYQSRDFSRIDLGSYVRDLSIELLQSLKINSGKIDLTIQADKAVFLDIGKVIPCGLILSELLSNALKHAFPGDGTGRIMVMINQSATKKIEIIIRDNGVGLPGDVNPHQHRTVGLHLVNGLVKNQLHGQMEVRSDNGTEFRITFH
jgi:PAS domain S-box-containing protein